MHIHKKRSGLLIAVKGLFHAQIYDVPRKSGTRRLIWEDRFPNGVTNGGLNDILGVQFNTVTQKTAWYFGLLDDNPTLSAGDTMSSHAGWTEATEYDEATRQQWTPLSVASQTISNTDPATVTIDSGGGLTVAGAFLTSNSTKGGTTGILWATGLFTAGDQVLADNQVFKINYQCTMTAS